MEKKMKKILPILLALAVLLTACAPQGTPTMAPADVQNTAVAAAWTVVAMTQAAIPTATLVPPTDTPIPTALPTFTAEPLIIPTLEPLILPTATSAAASDPKNCNKTLSIGEAGPLKNVRIENENKGPVNLSLTLYTPNLFGQCGSIGYVLTKGEKSKVGIPSGYWYAYAWVLKPPSTAEGSFYIGPSKSDDLLRLIIKKDIIVWVGP
jgi:hypothetical protein